jgi:hypothetical protein
VFPYLLKPCKSRLQLSVGRCLCLSLATKLAALRKAIDDGRRQWRRGETLDRVRLMFKLSRKNR